MTIQVVAESHGFVGRKQLKITANKSKIPSAATMEGTTSMMTETNGGDGAAPEGGRPSKY